MRIRPLIEGFAAETTAGIRGALTEVNSEVASSAKANVAATGTEVDANKALTDSYAEIAEAARTQAGGIDVVKAAVLEQQATVDAATKANVAATVQQIDANRLVAASYAEIAAAAVPGSEEQIAAQKLLQDAVTQTGVDVKTVAEANIQATAAQIASERELAATYREASAVEVAGTDRAIAVQKLLGDEAVASGAKMRAGAEEASIGIAGLKSHLLSLGTVLGIGFGAAIGVDLAKDAVEGAANVQKSGEVIRSEFGGAAQKVFVGFKDSVAANLGISAQLADQTSARFGLLFKQIGVGPAAAAQMTTGFEKLAGSINEIKGGGTAGAAQVLQSIVLAAAGNARGLKQLGIVVDTTSEKIALFGAAGLTMTGVLTPAQKAVAIYRIAMQNFGHDAEQARLHSQDLASEQARLSAQFSNAKDALGTALLPTFAKYTKELADWLGRMQESGKLQRDFNSAAKVAKGVVEGVVGAVKLGVSVWDKFSGAVGGTRHAVEILLAAMAVSKFAAIAGGVKNLAAVFIGPLKSAITGVGLLYTAVTSAMEGETLALAIVIRSALISTGIGALVVAVGIAAVEIINHWNTVKRWLIEFADWVKTHLTVIWKPYVDEIKTVVQIVVTEFDFMKGYIEAWVKFFETVWTHPIRAIEDLIHNLKNVFVQTFKGMEKIALNTALAIVEPFSHLPSFLGGWARKAKDAIQGQLDALDPTKTVSAFQAKSAELLAGDQGITPMKAAAKKGGEETGQSFIDGMKGPLQQVASTLTAPLKPILDQVQNAVQSASKTIQSTVQSAKDNLDKIGGDLAKTIEQIQAKIGGAAGAIAGSPQGAAFAKLKALIESGAPSFEIARAQASLSSQLQNVGKTQQPLIKTQLANLTSAFDKGQIGYKQFEERLHKILHDDGVTLQQALKAGGPAFADAFKAQVKALGDQAKQIADLPAKYRGVGGAGGAADIKIVRPLEVIRQENTKIAAAAQRQRDEQIRYAHAQARYQEELLKQSQKQTALQQEAAAYGVGGAVHAGVRRAASGGAHPETEIARPLNQIHTDALKTGAVAAGQRRETLTELRRLAVDVLAVGKDFAAGEQQLLRPVEVLHQDNVRIASRAEQQRDAQLRATKQTNSELRSLRKTNVNPLPGYGKYRKGKGSHVARQASAAGVKP